MAQVTFDITISLDGFVAGPDPSLEDPLGKGGESLHDWAVETDSWRAQHGLEGGEAGGDSEVMAEGLARQGAVVMGRRMFSSGSGPWEDDPKRDGWWGDDPPFQKPVFVLTHHEREPMEFENGTSYTFVTDGIVAALEQARAAAGDKDVLVAGGADTIQQALAAGAVDDFQVHVAPILLGGGARLFDELGSAAPRVEQTRVLHSPRATHLAYRVVK